MGGKSKNGRVDSPKIAALSSADQVRLSSSQLAIMFEHYNENARRALFFSRYEASRLDSRVIESEHILLGILREGGRPSVRSSAASR